MNYHIDDGSERRERRMRNLGIGLGIGFGSVICGAVTAAVVGGLINPGAQMGIEEDDDSDEDDDY